MNLNETNVSVIPFGAFQACYGYALEDIALGAVTSIEGQVFWKCTNLKSIDLSQCTTVPQIGNYRPFEGVNTENVTVIVANEDMKSKFEANDWAIVYGFKNFVVKQ